MCSLISRASSDECPWLPICVATLLFLRLSREVPRFRDGPCQWLLHVHVLVEIHRCRGNDRVQMIRRRDEHAVDVFLFVQHLAEVGVAGGLRQMDVLQALRACNLILHPLRVPPATSPSRAVPSSAGWWRRAGRSPCPRIPVDVAESNDVLTRQVDQIRAPHAADADARDVQEVAGRRHPGSRDHVAWDDRETGRGCCRLFQESAPSGARGRRVGRLGPIEHHELREKTANRGRCGPLCVNDPRLAIAPATGRTAWLLVGLPRGRPQQCSPAPSHVPIRSKVSPKT